MEIAHNSKQPDQRATNGDVKQGESDDEVPPFLKLNNDSNRREPNITYTAIDKTFCVHVSTPSSMTQTEAHKMFRLMGKDVETLEFRSEFNEKDITVHYDVIQWYMQQIAKYCSNLRKMIFSFEAFKTNLIEPLLSTVFQHVHTIVLRTSGEPFDINLLKCPNLKNVDTSFSVTPNSQLNRSERHEKYFEFFKQNPQLKSLKCDYNEAANFENVSCRLPNIDTLAIEFRAQYSLYENLNSFESLIHLGNSKFELCNLDREILFKITPIMPVLKNIKQFKVAFGKRNNANDETVSEIVTMVKKFPNLVLFELENLDLERKHVSQFNFGSVPNLKLSNCNIRW